MHFDISNNAKLDKVWEFIIKKLGDDAIEVCPNSSSFYKTHDGIECSLRKVNGDLVAICYREKNKSNGYRWTINKLQ